jgi:hypothetical protein
MGRYVVRVGGGGRLVQTVAAVPFWGAKDSLPPARRRARSSPASSCGRRTTCRAGR